MSANTRQEDFLFAEHVLRHGFATEDQVQQCLGLLERIRGELDLDETLENILLKKGYLAKAQAQVIQRDINPEAAGRAKNQIEGYQLLVRLGSGAMGSVYKAHYHKLDIPVALKVLRVDLAKSKTQIERLKREAQLAARLNHPNIVGSLDVGESNGFHYFAMEYVDGKTVRQALHPGRLREKEALRIMRDVASALEHAHAHGVIHRDVKPANIILTKGGKVKLADFGLARGKGPSDLTLDQASIGTPQYLAPEQARRGADATPRSDLFSLGASLYHMVTGRPPFSGENLGEIFQKVLHTEFDPPEVAVPDLSIDTLYLIHRLLRFHPRERYASATDLLADLDRIAAGQRIAPAEFKGDYQKYLQRRRLRHGLVAAAAILVVVVASLFTAQTISSHRVEGARAEKCRAANLVGKDDLEKPNSVEDLEDLHALMLRAASGQCEPGEISDLNRRLQLVTVDIGSLRAAEACEEAARVRGANFRQLLSEAARQRRRIQLDGPHIRARDIELAITNASARALTTRTVDVYNPGRYKTREDALNALIGFERELGTRFLDADDKRAEVVGHASALETLIREWDRAEEDYGPLYNAARSAHKYRAARDNLDQIVDAHKKARKNALRRGLDDDGFLKFFAKIDERELALRQAERSYFEKKIGAVADKHLIQSNPDKAEDIVLGFRPNAYETRGRVALLLNRINIARKDIVATQNSEIVKLGKLVRRALEDRQYGRAWKAISDADLLKWMPLQRAEMHRFVGKARIYKGLLDRFIKKAAATHRPVGGDDLDLFVKPDGKTTTLKEFDAADLEAILEFKDPEDTRLRGYFHLIESYVTHSPLEEAKRLAAAITFLSRAHDPLVVKLRTRELQVKSRNKAREQQAKEVHDEALKAWDKTDHGRTIAYLDRLRKDYSGSLLYTEYAEKNKSVIHRLWALAQLIGNSQNMRLRYGLPKDNFRPDPEHGTAWLKFDFNEWWPHDGQVPRHQLPKLASRFWKDHFRADPDTYPREQWPVLVPRAMHQLLMFNKHLVPDKKNGGARFHADISNRKLWSDWQDEEVGAIHLPHPFTAKRDWSIEITVVWDVDEQGNLRDFNKPKKDKTIEDYAVPGYFALAAGNLQMGLAASPEKYGGAGGVRLFVEESLTKGLEKRMEDFHKGLIGKKKFLEGGDRAYLEVDLLRRKLRARPFHEGEPYRIRLERKGLTLRCSITTLDVWNKRGAGGFGVEDLILSLKLSRREWAKHTGKVFRIFSINPSRLLEVVLTGHVAAE